MTNKEEIHIRLNVLLLKGTKRFSYNFVIWCAILIVVKDPIGPPTAVQRGRYTCLGWRIRQGNEDFLSTLFWAVAQRVEVIPCRCFGTTYRSLLQGSRIHENVPWVGYPETSVKFYHYTRHNSLEEPPFSYTSWQKPEITHKTRVTCKGKISWKFGKNLLLKKKNWGRFS
jgi:hypothetical protein